MSVLPWVRVPMLLLPPLPPVPDAMITQLVPLLCSRAQAPTVFGRIAVPAAPPICGTTPRPPAADDETTVKAAVLLRCRMRPGYVAAFCMVSVMDAAPLKISDESVAVSE